ncbi:MAG TPA: Crp/Fnr family transcriptional regulator [Caulobacteraceae bacterium]|nr:Crp/Fnr family transcriptional regulator [Caulobacteraceae bacterium]
MDKSMAPDVLDVRNLVLAGLRRDDRQALEPHLEFVSLGSGDILYEPGYPVDWVYFPNTAVLSVVTVMADGRTVESDTVGYESVVGALNALGDAPAISRTFTQIPGVALRLSAARLRRRADESVAMRRLLLRHTQANLAQAHQSVACNALHDLAQRLCRWLLMSHDRTAREEIQLTQQFLATMLGVQRTTVTEALRDLAEAGLIRQGRGSIHLLDRARMEAMVCECYDAVRVNLGRLIGDEPANG